MNWFAAADSAGEYWDEQALNELLVGCCEEPGSFEPPPIEFRELWQIPNLAETPQTREVQRWQWTPEEDLLLSRLAKQFNRDWNKIVEFFPNKSLSNIKKRYLNKHSPTIRKSNWTPQEDRVIMSLYAEQGCSWIQIAEHLPGRQPDAIKNRFYGTLRKKLSESEQARLARRPKVTVRPVSKADDDSHDSVPLSLFNEEDLRMMSPEEKLQRIEELCSKVNSLESFLGQAKKQISKLKATLSNENK
mmetsp:Transcript_20862/g.38719  ORF Transcript_20862/g.38719 Transcript_20862/m.38719 type:complete len:246 (+) Transcript_20862:586-1323(+)